MKLNEIRFDSISCALDFILQLAVLDIKSHSTCFVQSDNETLYGTNIGLEGTPMTRINCNQRDESFFQLFLSGVDAGCATFIVAYSCAEIFLKNFRAVHMDANLKFFKKHLIFVQDFEFCDDDMIQNFFSDPVIFYDLPLFLVISFYENEIDLWHRKASHVKEGEIMNKFFLCNNTFLKEDFEFFPKFEDLTGVELNVATINYPPYTFYEFVKPGTGNANLEGSSEKLSVLLDGVELYLCIEFCRKFNCTITLHREEEELWGDIFDNGTSTGLMNALVTSRSDVTIAAFYHWGLLFPFMQFSDSIQKVRVMHLVPKRKPLPYALTPLLPFDYTVWITMFLAYFTSIFVILWTNRVGVERREDAHEFGEVVIMILKLSLFEGTSVIETSSASEIIIFGFLFYFGMIVGNLYGGALASIMTIVRYEKGIDTISDIIHSNLIWGGPSIVFVFSIIDTQEPVLRYYLDHYRSMSMADLHAHGKAQNMTIILEAMQFGTVCIAEYMDAEVAQNYMLTKHDMYWEQTLMPSRKTWPYMDLMNKIILFQAESGVNRYWEFRATLKTMDYKIQKTIEENGKTMTGSDMPVKLSMEHIVGANYILLIGNLAGLVIFLLEIVWYYKVKWHTCWQKLITKYHKPSN